MPKNAKTAFKEVIKELSHGFCVEYLEEYPDLCTSLNRDTLTCQFDYGKGSITLQHSNASGAITIAIRKNKDDDEFTTIRYITSNDYNDSKEKLDQAKKIFYDMVYFGYNIDIVIEGINATFPKMRSFAERFAEMIEETLKRRCNSDTPEG